MARPRANSTKWRCSIAPLGFFGRRGHDGTSIAELVEATGVGRASLYGAFGAKEQLFARVLEHHGARAVSAAGELEHEPSVLRGIERPLRASLEHTCPWQGPRGCFALLAASTVASDVPLRALVERSTRATERAPRSGSSPRRWREGRRRGSSPRSATAGGWPAGSSSPCTAWPWPLASAAPDESWRRWWTRSSRCSAAPSRPRSSPATQQSSCRDRRCVTPSPDCAAARAWKNGTSPVS